MTHRPQVRGSRGLLRDERGDGGGTALVWLILLPVLTLLIWTGIQVAMSHYGQSMAIAAAQAGARAAVSTPAHPERAEAAVLDFLRSANATNDVQDPRITVEQDAGTVKVTVTGRSVQVVPGFDTSVTGVASAPLEGALG